MNQGLVDSLAHADAPLGEDIEFDWVMHTGIMKIGEESFQG